MPELELGIQLLLVAAGFIAGFVSSIAGAGGMIALPALLWAGVPPLEALGTNKFQSVFGTLSSTINFFSKGHLQLRWLLPGICAAILGSVVGVWLVQRLDADFLSWLLPVLLIVISLYFLMSPRVSDLDSRARMGRLPFNLLVGGGLGFYGGFFGPGMGSFFALAFVALLGFNMRAATAHTKPLVLATNTTAMLIFVAGGHIVWSLALGMSVAQALGARLGSNMVITRGAALVKPVLVGASLLIAIRLLLEQGGLL
ncbi:TSUP family transporter [Biformimicrobium ophioploci]|uniref:Probable membrane transporter protein n=1 Tax=Biformimicrobium ophioploci TaxID=3036711 RepID=A0ABQ6LYG7_9GAMM|nr:TSUP family transporter [Microbulbifer sp. NKW57]GMG87144.1 sulfite exporter TauE/SafE family protein [Microbulbifer sp. NKW57]